MKRIGIFGGSFDPVHLGHVSLAKDAMQQAGLERVIFVPARLQPFKLDKKMTSGRDRAAMLKAAIDGIPGFELSTYELDADGISYTYLTLEAIQKQMGSNTRLYFITGGDTFVKIHTWMNAKEWLGKYSYIIGTRPGYRMDVLKASIRSIESIYQTEVLHIENTQLDISSTEIRERVLRGQPISAMVPTAVERYITEHGIYGKELD